MVLCFRKGKCVSNRRKIRISGVRISEGNIKGILRATPMEREIGLNKRDAL